jgi:hypothetical protein
MARTPGSGRQTGTPNRLTTQFKDAVRTVYEDIGGHAAFAAWARENPGAFYQIASKLIPAEVNVRGQHEQIVVVLQDSPEELRARQAARLAAQKNLSRPAIEHQTPAGLQGDGGYGN